MTAKIMMRRGEQFFIFREIQLLANPSQIEKLSIPPNIVVGEENTKFFSLPQNFNFLLHCLHYDKENDTGYFFIVPLLKWIDE